VKECGVVVYRYLAGLEEEDKDPASPADPPIIPHS
jgi:hypothetical protein